MNKMVHFLVLTLLAIAAIASYSYGSATGIFIFLILGFIFETCFWVGLVRQKRRKAAGVEG